MSRENPGGPEGAPPLKPHLDIERASDEELFKMGLDISSKLDNVYGGFVSDALSKGMSRKEIEEAVVDAWNAGILPRVVRGEAHRGSGFLLHILHGEVPKDLFDRLERSEYSGVITAEGHRKVQLQETGSMHDEEVLTDEPDADNPHDFYVEYLSLAQTSRLTGSSGVGREEQLASLRRTIEYLDEEGVVALPQ